MNYKNKKQAFTLAETLITITIIGVVAAITIPILVSNYQNKVNETALKKANSILANSLSILRSKHGDNFLKERYPDNPIAEDFAEILKYIEKGNITKQSYLNSVKNPANGAFAGPDRMYDGYVKTADSMYLFRTAYINSVDYAWIW